MPMPNLNDYLERIHYRGSLEPTLDTLKALHRAHLMAVPYENLDLHLGRSLPLDQMRAVEKIVTQGRGGWCYEMNGVFAWVLREMGFEPNTQPSIATSRQRWIWEDDRRDVIEREFAAMVEHLEITSNAAPQRAAAN